MKIRIIITFFVIMALLGLFVSCEPETFNKLGSISGTVIDFHTGEPLDDALITLTPKSKPNIYSGTEGQFEFKEVEEGQYTVAATKTGYEADRTIVNVKAGEIVNASLTMKKR